MGRQQNLTRLALGRSAFEDADPAWTAPGEHSENDGARDEHEDVQQYDSKGRPFNPSTDTFNATLRDAQNEILSLTGVVERKDQSNRLDGIRRRFILEHRQTMLRAEEDCGELLEYIFTPLKFVSHLWTTSFIAKIQIGFYDPRLSIVDILIVEWGNIWKRGLRLLPAAVFPAFGRTLTHALVRLPLIIAVEQITGRLQAFVQRRQPARRARRRIYHAISILFEALLLGIDIALLPMEYHACNQRLGLAPVIPLLPSLSSFWPWSPGAFHRFAWKPIVSTILLKWLTSPAALLLLHRVIYYEDDDTETPIYSLFTPYRYPAINVDSSVPSFNADRPRASQDPIGWILDKAWLTRSRFLQWCGWNIVYHLPRSCSRSRRPADNRLEDHDLDTIFPTGASQHADFDPKQPLPYHRSTILAHLPAKVISCAVDNLFARLLTLPFESLLLRTIARTYITHSSSGGAAAAAAALHLYAPFGGGPITQLLRSPSDTTRQASAGLYLNRLGLALALNTSVDIILFFGMYGMTRHIGRTRFSWGDGKKGGFGGGADTGSVFEGRGGV